MRKRLYLVCLCCLSFIILYALKINLSEKSTRSERIIPTSYESAQSNQFLEKVKEENKNCKKVAYLTFDDGPSEITPLVLDTLKEKGVKATFFLIGEEVVMTPKRQETVLRMAKEGHAIGVHTDTHKKNKIYSCQDNFFNDFDLAKYKIKEITGMDVRLHRYPWGSTNSFLKPMFGEVTAQLQKRGIKSYDWHASGEDSLNDGICEEEIIANVEKTYSRYIDPIILLHDNHIAKQTALALGNMIDMISEKGYLFDTLEKREAYLFPESCRE